MKSMIINFFADIKAKLIHKLGGKTEKEYSDLSRSRAKICIEKDIAICELDAIVNGSEQYSQSIADVGAAMRNDILSTKDILEAVIDAKIEKVLTEDEAEKLQEYITLIFLLRRYS